jgi:predicted RNA-binding Zn ribbon-like protein
LSSANVGYNADMTVQSAPGQLELVRTFVNTLDLEGDSDELSSPEALTSWLAERHLLSEGMKVGRRALERAIELREALRRLLLANNGAALDPEAIEALNDTIADAALSVRFEPDGQPALAVRSSGPGAVVAPIVTIVYEAMVNGTWSRLKACPADDCHWAFYDHSKNHSGTWCTMRVCGNRAKVRAYRERQGRAGPVPKGR